LVEKEASMTLREFFAVLLMMAGFLAMGIALGASIMWRLAVLPRRALVSPPWVWIVAMTGTWGSGIGLILAEQWFLAISAAALGLVFVANAIASWRMRRREER
jgi:hypothetical protein